MTQIAFTSCLGGMHKAVNPHRQRLLVASNKTAKLASTAKTGAAGASKKTPEPADVPPEPTKDAAAKKRSDTQYGLERKKFLAGPLGLAHLFFGGSRVQFASIQYHCKVRQEAEAEGERRVVEGIS